MHDHLYRRCQELATAAGRTEYERHAAAHRKKSKHPVPALRSGEAMRWVALFEEFSRGRISEEHIKGCLLERFIPIDSPVPTFASYVITRFLAVCQKPAWSNENE